MSIDDRLRTGLRRNADNVASHTERALHATHARARRGARRRWARRGAAVVVAAVAAVLALPQLLGSAPDNPPTQQEPPQLVGSWSTQVAPGSLRVDTARLAGTWTLTFTADGALNATPPGAYPGTLAGDTYQVTDAANGSRLHTNLLAADTCAGVGVGTFYVRRAGGALRFRLVSDPCPARVALLTGRLWTPARPGASCVNNGGGACLGDLAAGSYRTRQFRPTVHYTVPADWTNPQDLPGNLLLQPAGGDERFVGIYRNVTVPDGCAERADPAVGTSVEAIVNWLVHHPGLQVSAPVPATVGGLNGVRLDVSLARDWRTTCPFSTGRPIVAILFGAGPAVLHHTLLPGWAERLYLLRLDAAPGKPGASGTGTGNLVIEVGPEGRDLPELVQAAQPLLSSIRFGSTR